MNVYISNIRENVDKRIKFDTTMSVAKISIQVTIVEGITSELAELLTQFIMKYRRNTGLNIDESSSIIIKNNCQ